VVSRSQESATGAGNSEVVGDRTGGWRRDMSC
jgi:hypothetical protein